MSSKSKTMTLRAFSIKSLKISDAKYIFNKLTERFKISESADDRSMVLNLDDPNEKDLISNFDKISTPSAFFCTMLRLMPGEDAQQITKEILKKKTFSIVEELENSAVDQKDIPEICKEHYYFSISNKYVVTNLPGNKSIKNLQTYLAWLLNEDLFELTPMVTIPKGISLDKISNITFSDSFTTNVYQPNSVQSLSDTKTQKFNLQALGRDCLKWILSDVKTLSDSEIDGFISADLIIKFKKSKDSSKEDFEKIMGAIIKPMSDLDGVVLKPKKGPIIKGSEIHRKKVVSVSTNSSGRINEHELRQEMSKFLSELIDNE